MSNMSDYLENKTIDWFFRAQAAPTPTHLYVALWTAALNDASTGATAGEVGAGLGYARQDLPPSLTNWAATNAPGSVVNPSTGTSGTTSNNVAIPFGPATGSWGSVTYVAILDSATLGAGNILFWGVLTTAKTVGTGDTVAFAAGNLQVQIDN